MHPQYLFHAIDAFYREDQERAERERRRVREARRRTGVLERRLRRVRSRNPARHVAGPRAC